MLKNHRTVHFKWMNCMVNKFYLNKAAYKGRKSSDENYSSLLKAIALTMKGGNSINNEKERTEKVGR